MASKKDYYETLGINKDASEADIKSAYRKMAKKYHPDLNSGDEEAAHKFKEVNEAYQVLGDDKKRAQYDQFGHAAFDGTGGAGGGGFGGFDDFMGGMGGFGDIFDSFFGGGGRRAQNGPTRGNDLRYNMEISFEEAAFGLKKEVQIRRKRGVPRLYRNRRRKRHQQTYLFHLWRLGASTSATPVHVRQFCQRGSVFRLRRHRRNHRYTLS